MIIILQCSLMAFLLTALFSICYVGLIPVRKLPSWCHAQLAITGLIVLASAFFTVFPA